MSERLGLLFVLLLAAAPLRGQEVERLERRERALVARLEMLRQAAAARADSLFAGQRREVVTAGGVVVAVPQAAVTLARASLPAVVERARARYGAALDSLLRDTLYVWNDADLARSGVPVLRVSWRLGALRDSLLVPDDADGRASWVGWVMAGALERWAFAQLDPALHNWARAGGLPADLVTAERSSVQALMRAPSVRARRCLAGSLEECARVLDLSGPESPLDRWYEPEEWPAVADRTGALGGAPGRAACVGQRRPEACATLFARRGVAPPVPVDPEVRRALFAFAADLGGPGAWLRLRAARGGSVSAQLAAAAGRPFDDLLSAWHADLVRHHGTEAARPLPLVASLGWSLILVALFAWRYRWRHV